MGIKNRKKIIIFAALLILGGFAVTAPSQAKTKAPAKEKKEITKPTYSPFSLELKQLLQNMANINPTGHKNPAEDKNKPLTEKINNSTAVEAILSTDTNPSPTEQNPPPPTPQPPVIDPPPQTEPPPVQMAENPAPAATPSPAFNSVPAETAPNAKLTAESTFLPASQQAPIYSPYTTENLPPQTTQALYMISLILFLSGVALISFKPLTKQPALGETGNILLTE